MSTSPGDTTDHSRCVTPRSQEDERFQQIRQVVDDCLVQRATGQPLSDADLTARHPELMPQLGHELERARLIACARARVDQEQVLAADNRHLLTGHRPKDGPPTHLLTDASSVRLQCPNCQAM